MFALTPGNGSGKAKTFSNQKTLPRLPIPSLEHTLEQYIQSLEPILLQAEEFGQLPPGSNFEKELQKRRRWASDALQSGSLLRRLQQRLHDVDRTSPNNWLDDGFWIQKAYHESRAPLVGGSSTWLATRADPGTPAASLEDSSIRVERSKPWTLTTTISQALGQNDWQDLPWGIRRATWLTYRFLLFKRHLDDESFIPDVSRGVPLCMHPYTRFYGINRIPGIARDYNTQAQHPLTARHIVVLVRNNIFVVDVINEEGHIIALPELERRLTNIVDDARREDGVPIGILTATHRDHWARTREHLLSVSSLNRESLKTIEDSLFVLAIDSSVLPLPEDFVADSCAATPESLDAHTLNVSGIGRLGHNRWFDKSFNIIVEPNGRAGYLSEHSPCDSVSGAMIATFVAAVPAPKLGEKWADDLPGTEPNHVNTGLGYRRLQFDIDHVTQTSIDLAHTQVRAECGQSDICKLWFADYGTDWIKKVAKQSPDTYIQLAMQLAMCRVSGEQTPTYQPASMRKFRHGRTEAIRTFSRESYEFVRAVREGRSASEVYKLMSTAATAHIKQAHSCAAGQGADRHLMVLRLLYDVTEDGVIPSKPSSGTENLQNASSKPASFYAGTELIFTDPLFEASQSWRLITSGMIAAPRFTGGGFVGVRPDGYGVTYYAEGHCIKFDVGAKHPTPRGPGQLGNNPADKMRRALVESLQYMHRICELEASKSTDASLAVSPRL